MRGSKILKFLSMELLFLVIALFSASAETEKGFEYRITESGAEITDWTGSDTDVMIPSSLGNFPVVGIGKNAFSGNPNIFSIVMPSSIEYLGERAFADCTNLTIVNNSSRLKVIGKEAFAGCSAISSFTIPTGIESIRERAFADCGNLLYINDLSGEAFSFVGSGAFDDTAWLKTNTHEFVTLCHGHMLVKYHGTAESPAIPWTVMSIAADAFSGNETIRELVLPNFIQNLYQSAISDLPNLEKVSGGAGLVYAAEGAFRNLPKLCEVDLPLTDLNANHFWDCIQSPFGTLSASTYDPSIPDPADTYFITDFDNTRKGIIILHCRDEAVFENGVMEIPDMIRGIRVVSIGSGACQNRNDITELKLPDSLQVIQNWAFAYDTNLRTVAFPENLQTIEADAFNNCAISLTPPTLPETDVDERAFYLSWDYHR